MTTQGVEHEGSETQPTHPLDLAKQRKRMRVLVWLVEAWRERRDQEKKGVVFPPPPPEQKRDGDEATATFMRWMKGDDSVGDLSADLPAFTTAGAPH